ncbi:hypothetical protein AVEN_114971-1 [Araneus ventricosus]|uniref:Mariner Mos1 transposase n=1 Tax=Araneus ventricosus TaxID=182803 RepID=A0A4Y2D820_ARAVE|nr:hypothetical protein AVEN_114971-1 [Araneus ventricosus]
MLEVFFDYDSVIHYEFIPGGQTVNKELYLEILKRLRDAIRRKGPEKWAANDCFLLHDNAPPHRALIVKKYLAIETPPYSPDLAPADFYLFPRLKMKLKGHRFVDSDKVIKNATKQLKDLSKNGFQECFEQLYEHWKKCVDAGESTLKANKSNPLLLRGQQLDGVEVTREDAEKCSQGYGAVLTPVHLTSAKKCSLTIFGNNKIEGVPQIFDWVYVWGI